MILCEVVYEGMGYIYILYVVEKKVIIKKQTRSPLF